MSSLNRRVQRISGATSRKIPCATDMPSGDGETIIPSDFFSYKQQTFATTSRWYQRPLASCACIRIVGCTAHKRPSLCPLQSNYFTRCRIDYI